MDLEVITLNEAIQSQEDYHQMFSFICGILAFNLYICVYVVTVVS